MDDLTFFEGWALLTAQPYAQFLAYDDIKFQTQQGLFQRAFAAQDGPVYLRVIEQWIRKESQWPTLPELLALMKAKAPMTRVALMAPTIEPSYLPRQIYQRAKAENRSIREVALEVLEAFLATCPTEHADYERAAELLGKAQQGFPVHCDCGQWHAACQPCPVCDTERHRVMREGQRATRDGPISTQDLPDVT